MAAKTPAKGSSPAQTAPQIKKEIPPPIVTPSAFASASVSVPFIHYSSYTAPVSQFMKSHDMSAADQFHGKPLSESLSDVVQEFDSLSVDQIVSSPSQCIKDFTEYVKSHIDPQANRFLISSWPGVIPAGPSNVVLYFIIACIHSSKNPSNIVTWLTRCVFPPTFTKPSDQLKGICRCKKAKKPGFWAVLDNENNFKLYTFKKADPVIDFQDKIDGVTIAPDKLTVQIKKGAKVVCSFIPEDPPQIKLWETILKDRAQLVKYMTSFMTPAIDEMYKATYPLIVNSDALILRSVLSSEMLKPENAQASQVLNSFFTCFSYARKVPAFVASVLVTDFGALHADYDAIIARPSHTRNLFKTVCSQYSTPYIKGFITKLAQYIDQAEGFGIGTDNADVGKLEIHVANIVKFIAHSFNEIPQQITFVLSMVASFVALHTNNKLTIYRSVAQLFLLDFIVPTLNSIKAHYPGVKHPEIFAPLSRLLYVVFSLGKMDSEFAKFVPLENRLQKHTYPLLFEFAFTISEIPEVETVFTTPKADQLARAIEGVLAAMTANVAKLQEIYDRLSNGSGPSILGSSCACLLSNLFLREADCSADDELSISSSSDSSPEPSPLQSPIRKNYHTKLIRADRLDESELEGKVVRKVVPIDHNKVIDPSQPKKYYKKVIKHVPRQ